MKIVFYNTTSTYFRGKGDSVDYFPRRADEWTKLAEEHPEHEIILVTKLPANYLLDLNGEEIAARSEKIQYVLMGENDSVDDVVNVIRDLAPELAVAISAPAVPLDWNFLKEAVIAEKLEEYGIKTIAQKVSTAMAFFDKWRSQLAFRSLGIDVAKGIYVHNDLFRAEENSRIIANNVYKEYVLYRVSQLAYPVIIKDTVGAGSMGLLVAKNFEEAKEALLSEKNDTDLLVEEMIEGEQFGTEIHGVKGSYSVLPPFKFSTTDEGITDPFQSVKYGPVTSDKYHIKQLQESLRRIAESFEFAASAQIDLVFKDDKWYVIEVNPRWSGMTTTTAAAEGRSPFEIYMESAIGSKKDYSEWDNLKYTLNFKIPALETEELKRLDSFDFVKFIMKYDLDKSKGVMPYCEVVIGGADTGEELLDNLRTLKKEVPSAVSDIVIKNAEELVREAK